MKQGVDRQLFFCLIYICLFRDAYERISSSSGSRHLDDCIGTLLVIDA
jgi:hypothetical protein